MEPHQAQACAEKLRKIIADHVFKVGDISLAITTRIGFILYKFDDNFEEAFKRADVA